jgi:hypothetical protein
MLRTKARRENGKEKMWLGNTRRGAGVVGGRFIFEWVRGYARYMLEVRKLFGLIQVLE